MVVGGRCGGLTRSPTLSIPTADASLHSCRPRRISSTRLRQPTQSEQKKSTSKYSQVSRTAAMGSSLTIDCSISTQCIIVECRPDSARPGERHDQPSRAVSRPEVSSSRRPRCNLVIRAQKCPRSRRGYHTFTVIHVFHCKGQNS